MGNCALLSSRSMKMSEPLFYTDVIESDGTSSEDEVSGECVTEMVSEHLNVCTVHGFFQDIPRKGKRS